MRTAFCRRSTGGIRNDEQADSWNSAAATGWRITRLTFTDWMARPMDGRGAKRTSKRCTRKFDWYLEIGPAAGPAGFITLDNINQLIQKSGLDRELDLLSIDIDGNDYWIWEAINGIRPRVAVIEYNAYFVRRTR